MKVDLEKVAKLEAKWVGKPVAIGTLERMVNIVLNTNDHDLMGLDVMIPKALAIETLKDLNILIDSPKEFEPLNS